MGIPADTQMHLSTAAAADHKAVLTHPARVTFKQRILVCLYVSGRRCQHTLTTACPAMQQKMVDTLLYVHHAWSNAGL